MLQSRKRKMSVAPADGSKIASKSWSDLECGCKSLSAWYPSLHRYTLIKKKPDSLSPECPEFYAHIPPRPQYCRCSFGKSRNTQSAKGSSESGCGTSELSIEDSHWAFKERSGRLCNQAGDSFNQFGVQGVCVEPCVNPLQRDRGRTDTIVDF